MSVPDSEGAGEPRGLRRVEPLDRATAVAPANIAFTKYWGWRDALLTLPHHDTISMNLSACTTTTTVARVEGGRTGVGDRTAREHDAGDQIEITGPDGAPVPMNEGARQRVSAHLDFLASVAHALETRGAGAGDAVRAALAAPPGNASSAGAARTRAALRVTSRNAMPAGAGIASSASGFAALTVAACAVLGIAGDTRALSILTRRSGSGSACRSIPDGFTRWRAGHRADGTDSFAESLHGADHWALADVLAMVERGHKSITSREGHAAAATSPLYPARLAAMPERNARVVRALERRDLELLGETLEEDCLEMHRVAETSEARARYLTAATEKVLRAVRELRRGGTPAWFTLDAGPNVHVVCEAAQAADVRSALERVAEVEAVLVNRACAGASRLDVRDVRLLGLFGPSGAGKTTLARALCRRWPERYQRIRTLSTRSPRPDDEGTYEHVSAAGFERLREAGELAAATEIPSSTERRLYGYRWSDLLAAARSRRILVAPVESRLASALRDALPSGSLLVVGLRPPGKTREERLAVLRERLAPRHAGEPGAVEDRLRNAEREDLPVLEDPAGGAGSLLDEVVETTAIAAAAEALDRLAARRLPRT